MMNKEVEVAKMSRRLNRTRTSRRTASSKEKSFNMLSLNISKRSDSSQKTTNSLNDVRSLISDTTAGTMQINFEEDIERIKELEDIDIAKLCLDIVSGLTLQASNATEVGSTDIMREINTLMNQIQLKKVPPAPQLALIVKNLNLYHSDELDVTGDDAYKGTEGPKALLLAVYYIEKLIETGNLTLTEDNLLVVLISGLAMANEYIQDVQMDLDFYEHIFVYKAFELIDLHISMLNALGAAFAIKAEDFEELLDRFVPGR